MIRRLAPSHPVSAFPSILVLGFLVLVPLGGPVRAIEPIDDFEVGPFAFQSVGGYQDNTVVIPFAAGHVITPERGVVLEPADGSAVVSVQLSTGVGDDAVVQSLADGSRTRLVYDFGSSQDLTAGGVYDRIEVHYDHVTPGSYFSLGIGDDMAFCSNERFPSGNPGVVTWPLDYCSSLVQPTDVERVILYCRAFEGDAEFEVSSIRLMRSGAYVPQIVREFLAIDVPPLPTPPIPWTLLTEAGEPLFEASMVLDVAEADDGTTPPLRIETAAVPFGDGSQVRSTIRVQDNGDPPFAVAFGLSFALDASGAGTPVFSPDIEQDTNLFDVTLATTIDVEDGRSLLGDAAVRLGLSIPPLQPFVLTDLAASVTADGTLEVRLEMISDGTSEPDEPLLEIVWESDWREETVTGVGSPVAVGPAARSLVAAPNVTTSSTTLRPSQVFGAGATVRIYDVAGRLVRELSPAVGGQALVWDGRDAGGMATASGTYLVRWREPGGETATARVVRVR